MRVSRGQKSLPTLLGYDVRESPISNDSCSGTRFISKDIVYFIHRLVINVCEVKGMKTIRYFRVLAIFIAVLLIPSQVIARVVDGNPPGLERAMAAKETHSISVMQMAGVQGVGVGVRGDGAPVIRVFVESAASILPTMLDGVPVHKVVSGRFYARKPPCPPKCPDDDGDTVNTDPATRFKRPVPIGISTGHPDITAGTIGCRALDGSAVYALSNNHVYANENNAGLGEVVLQPGAYDGGGAGDEIGTLADFEPIMFNGESNVMDAAIALSSTELLGNATPDDGYGVPLSAHVEPQLNMAVMKYGRTTGQTKGKVFAINVTANVGYSSGTATFVDQIVISPGKFSAPGDSGSLIVVQRGEDTRSPVGLLFAGSNLYTIATPISRVFDRFGITCQ